MEQITALLIGLNIRYQAHGTGIRITGLPDRQSGLGSARNILGSAHKILREQDAPSG